MYKVQWGIDYFERMKYLKRYQRPINGTLSENDYRGEMITKHLKRREEANLAQFEISQELLQSSPNVAAFFFRTKTIRKNKRWFLLSSKGLKMFPQKTSRKRTVQESSVYFSQKKHQLGRSKSQMNSLHLVISIKAKSKVIQRKTLIFVG